MSGRRLVATLACRNQGSRLYGKPVQNLDVEAGIKIIDNIISCLLRVPQIDETVLAISHGEENNTFITTAIQFKLQYIFGDEHDVLARIIHAGEMAAATDIFRVTTESPFTSHEMIEELWHLHVERDSDATFLEPSIDGCGIEIISLDALKRSHNRGETRHRSEMCSLYMRENPTQFKIDRVAPAVDLQRLDLRLTVDNPEDLVVCRHIYAALKHSAPMIPISEIVKFLDRNEPLKILTAPFLEIGYSTMYL